MGRRGGPQHMRWVRGSVDRWLAGSLGRRARPGAFSAPIPPRYGPRPLATGPPTLAHVASLAARRTNPATGPPRARTDETNSVAKRGCSRGPSHAIWPGKYLTPSASPAVRLPAVRLPLGAAWHTTCNGAAVGRRGAGGGVGVGEGIERREIPSFTFFNPSFSAPFPPAPPPREIAREECERRVRPQPNRVSGLLRQEFIHPP
jgi:hypothetical protein